MDREHNITVCNLYVLRKITSLLKIIIYLKTYLWKLLDRKLKFGYMKNIYLWPEAK